MSWLTSTESDLLSDFIAIHLTFISLVVQFNKSETVLLLQTISEVVQSWIKVQTQKANHWKMINPVQLLQMSTQLSKLKSKWPVRTTADIWNIEIISKANLKFIRPLFLFSFRSANWKRYCCPNQFGKRCDHRTNSKRKKRTIGKWPNRCQSWAIRQTKSRLDSRHLSFISLSLFSSKNNTYHLINEYINCCNGFDSKFIHTSHTCTKIQVIDTQKICI